MEIAETSCDHDTDTHPRPAEERLTGPLSTRLHSRVMVTAYKYKLMSPEEDGVGDGFHKRAGNGNLCLMRACLVILTVIVIVLAALLGWVWTNKDRGQVCLTPECVDVSAYILGKMNQSADPCVDFYQFACGGWESRTILPPDQAKYDTFAEVNNRNRAIIRQLLEEKSTWYKGRNSSAVAKLKIFYHTCMDVDKIEADGTGPILQKIEELGSWSISPNHISANRTTVKDWDLMTSLIRWHKLGYFPLLAFGLSTDAKNSSNRLLAFYQSGLTLDSEEEYLQDAAKFKDAFLSFAVATARLLGGDSTTPQKMEAIYNLEKRLAQIFVNKEKRRDPLYTYNLMTVAEFQQIIGDQVDVKRLMSGVLDREMEDSQVVRVAHVDYFRRLGHILANTSPQVVQDYFMWHMVQQQTGYLPQAFIDAVMVLNQVETGVSTLKPRWERCIVKAEFNFGFVSSALYVEKVFPPESKAQALKIMGEVQTAFIENLQELKWMDDSTRDRARVKAQTISKAVGYPEWIMDPQKLDDHYEKAVLPEGKFLDIHFAMDKFSVDQMWAKLGTKPDKDMWGERPDEANAFFSSTFNQIIILAGLLQRPFFDRRFPRSFAYGAMGMISGHELTHGFDKEGRKFNKDGNLDDWWTPAATQAFKERSQCMVNQYSAMTWDGTHLNGNYTLNENIADNGGLKLGYAAYLKAKARGEWEEFTLPGVHLTPQQLFFVGFAQIWCGKYTPAYAQHSILTDEHTLDSLRVQGSVANVPQFAEAYSCPADAPLNPDHRCSVW